MDSLDPLLDDLVGDERNVLLTLARMIVTLESGEIVSKDEAVRRVLPTVDDHSRAVLAYAAAGYLGEVDDDWTSGSRAAGPRAAPGGTDPLSRSVWRGRPLRSTLGGWR